MAERERAMKTQPSIKDVKHVNLESLSEFCVLANKIILAFYGDRKFMHLLNRCSLGCADSLRFDAKPLRVEAAMFDTKPGGRGVVLGRFSSP